MTSDSEFETLATTSRQKTGRKKVASVKKTPKKVIWGVDVSQIKTEFQLEGKPFELLENCPGTLL